MWLTAVTVDDSKGYTRPWTVTLKQAIVVDTELVDEICLEKREVGPANGWQVSSAFRVGRRLSSDRKHTSEPVQCQHTMIDGKSSAGG